LLHYIQFPLFLSNTKRTKKGTLQDGKQEQQKDAKKKTTANKKKRAEPCDFCIDARPSWRAVDFSEMKQPTTKIQSVYAFLQKQKPTRMPCLSVEHKAEKNKDRWPG